jgi:hypothetical protein
MTTRDERCSAGLKPTTYRSALIVAATMMMAFVFPLPSASAAGSKGFCEAAVIRDYEKPLREMPVVRHVPENGKIPGGPGGFRLHPTLRVHSEAGMIGFSVAANEVSRVWWPGWRVQGTFWQVTRSGRKISSSRRQKRFAGTVATELRYRDLIFRVSDRSGFYLIDIVFQRDDGGVQERFSEYFRVMQPRTDIRVTTSRPSYNLGEPAFIRVENFGTTGFDYGPYYLIERLDGDVWTEVPALGGSPAAKLWGLGRGIRSYCQRVALPPEIVSPGRYRVTKDGRAVPGRQRIYARAEFDVLP